MLPGFRFIFAAIVLLMSILVFGFGATALLDTARDEFASAPAWQPLPETRFAQESLPTQPVLAVLQVDDAAKATQPPPPADHSASQAELPAPDNTPVAAPAAEQQVATVPADEAPAVSPPAAGETDAQPAPQTGTTDAEATTVDSPVANEAAQTAAVTEPTAAPANEAAPAPATPVESAPALTPAESPVPAISADASPASAPAAAATPAPQASPAPEQTSALPSPTASENTAKIVTLGAPPVDIVDAPKAKPTDSKAEKGKAEKLAEKKRQAQREAARRRRIAAARARLARQQAAWAAQQAADPFAQPTITAQPPPR